MRYLVTILAAAAILFSQAAFTPAQAQAGENDGIKNRIILVDSRGHRRDHRRDYRWDRRDHRRDHRWDRRRDRRRDHRERYSYWQHNRHRHGYRPYFSGRNSNGFYWWEVPIPGPLPLFIPVPR